jgi:ABC-2 type transport system permease protein
MNVTWILIRREFIERVRQKSFMWATALGAVGIILLALLPMMLSSLSQSNATRLVIVAPDATTALDTVRSLKSSGDATTVASMHSTGPDLPAKIRAAMAKDTYDAALVGYRDQRNRLAYAYYPKTSSALQDSGSIEAAVQRAVLLGDAGPQRAAIEDSLKFKFDVHSLNTRYKNEADSIFSIGIVYFLLVILYIAVIVYGMQVATGVIEEKANRIMEIMIGAVRPSQLLAGKIFGISAVALLQLSINAVAAAVAAVIAGVLYGAGAASQQAASAAAATPQAQAMMSRVMSEGLPSVPWGTLIFLIVFFFLGFFSYAAIYAGIGSLLSKPEEVQQYSTVFMVPIVAAYILAIFALTQPDIPIVKWGSMIPLVSPLLMFTRISTSNVPWWQIAISIGASIITIWGLTIFAGKLYRVGVLMYGKPPTVKEIWRALRSPT